MSKFITVIDRDFKLKALANHLWSHFNTFCNRITSELLDHEKFFFISLLLELIKFSLGENKLCALLISHLAPLALCLHSAVKSAYSPSVVRVLAILTVLLESDSLATTPLILSIAIDICWVSLLPPMSAMSSSIMDASSGAALQCALVDEAAYNCGVLSSFLATATGAINAFLRHSRASTSEVDGVRALVDYVSQLLSTRGAVAVVNLIAGDDEHLSLFLLHMLEIELQLSTIPASLLPNVQALFSHTTDAVSLFALFAEMVIAYDESAFVDFLCQPETHMLKYFLRITKVMALQGIPVLRAEARAIDENAVEDAEEDSTGRCTAIVWVRTARAETLQEAMAIVPAQVEVHFEQTSQKRDPPLKYVRRSTAREEFRLFLSRLSATLRKLGSKNIVPFNPQLLVNRLDLICKMQERSD